MSINNNIIPTRVAELSATLPPIEQPYNDCAFDEMWGEANDFICYNSPYYYNGLQRVEFGGSENTCVLQAIEDYQVLRFFSVNVYMSGEQMFRYYTEEFEHQEDPNWMDDEYYEPDELELQGIEEYRQVWIDRQGNVSIINLCESGIDDLDAFVSVKSLQDWSCEPQVYDAIMANVSEREDYYHSDNTEPTLRFYLSQTAEYLRNNERHFYDVIVNNHLYNEASKYYRTFRVAHRHNYTFPTDYQSAKIYLDYLSLLSMDNENLLTQPNHICPVDLIDAYNRIDRRRHELHIKEQKLKAEQKEQAFAEQHSWLFGIEFDDEHFHYQSLDSVEAYRIEGDIMHHCIYQCQYYDKPYYLSMHISDHEGNRVATCTIDLQRREINQLQTICNDREWRQGNEYKRIWNTLMARMHTFPKPQQKDVAKKINVRIA